jgi:hypothetical protein
MWPPITNDENEPQQVDINQLRNIPSVMDRISQLYQPQHSAQDALNQTLSNFPQRPNPTGFQKVLAALATIGQGGPAAESHGAMIGYKSPNNMAGVYDSALYRDYNNQVADWSNKIKPLEYAANEERYYNTNQRQLAEQTARNETQRDVANEKERHNQAVEAAVQFKQAHPDWRQVTGKAGTVVFVNPKDPNQIVDTKLDSGKMTDYDRIRLQGDIRKDIVNTQQAGATQREREAQSAATGRENIRQSGADVRAANKPNSAGGPKPMTPAQQKVDLYNKAQKALSEHPEWSDYIKLAPGNNFMLSTPPWYKGGKDKATFDTVHDAIYGPSQQAAAPKSPPNAAPSAPQQAPKEQPSGRRLAISDNRTGKVIGTIPEEQEKSLDKSKYTVVR